MNLLVIFFHTLNELFHNAFRVSFGFDFNSCPYLHNFLLLDNFGFIFDLEYFAIDFNDLFFFYYALDNMRNSHFDKFNAWNLHENWNFNGLNHWNKSFNNSWNNHDLFHDLFDDLNPWNLHYFLNDSISEHFNNFWNNSININGNRLRDIDWNMLNVPYDDGLLYDQRHRGEAFDHERSLPVHDD